MPLKTINRGTTALATVLLAMTFAAPSQAQTVPHGSQGALPDLYQVPMTPKEMSGGDVPEAAPAGRFSRLFPINMRYTAPNGRQARLTPHPSDIASLRRLGEIGGPLHEQSDAESRDSNVPVGFVFFGQFIDHDVTFDTVSRLDRPANARDTENARTPGLDLDSIYGGGPERSPYLYDLPYLALGDEIVPGRHDVLRRGGPSASASADSGPTYAAGSSERFSSSARQETSSRDAAYDFTGGDGGSAGGVNAILGHGGSDTVRRAPEPRDPEPVQPRADPQPQAPAHPFARGRDLSRVALIGDPRNDENVVISQMQAAFITYHNSIVDRLLARDGVSLDSFRQRIANAANRGEQRQIEAELHRIQVDVFERARNHTIHYYHKVIVEDYLPRIIGQNRVNDIRVRGRQFYYPDGFSSGSQGTVEELRIPIEFSTAAFRYGHSQVRGSYNLNSRTRDVPLFGIGQGPGGIDMMGFKPMTPDLMIDWNLFFPMDPSRLDEMQSARPIDTRLPTALFELVNAGVVPAGDVASLASRNLNRGRIFRLPSGQAIAAAMGLGPRQIVEADPAVRSILGVDETPLWYYILQEAKQQGIRRLENQRFALADAAQLAPTAAVYSGNATPEAQSFRVKESTGSSGGDILGPVGGTIVGEVLLALIDHYRITTGRGLDFLSEIDRDMTYVSIPGSGRIYQMGGLMRDAGLANPL